MWQRAWSEFVPFSDYDVEIRRVICSTNAIESINARDRRAIRVTGHLLIEQAAMKCFYLVTRSLDPTGRGKARWAMRWTSAQRVRHRLRRPNKTDQPLANAKAGSTVNRTLPGEPGIHC